MFCKECGDKLADDAKFCPNCGVGVAKPKDFKERNPDVAEFSKKRERKEASIKPEANTNTKSNEGDTLASIGDTLRSMGYSSIRLGSIGVGLSYFVLWKCFEVSLLITIPVVVVLILFCDTCVNASYKQNPDDDEENPEDK